MSVTTDDLKRLMTGLADEVEVISLHDAAMAASRRSRTRRTVIASVAAFALVGGGVAVAATIPGGDGAPAANPSTDDDRITDTDVVPTSGIIELDGIYFIEEMTGDEGSRLWRWNGDDEPDLLVDIGEDGRDGIDVITPTSGTIAVSPDGSNAAWITSDGHPWIRDLEKGAKDDVGFADGISDPDCYAPSWTNDSSRVHFQTSEEWAFLYEPGTDKVFPVAPMPGCHVQLAETEGGELVRFSLVTGDNNPPVLWRAIGDGAPEPLDVTIPPDTGMYRLAAASPDGLFLCVSLRPSPGCSRFYDIEADEYIDFRLGDNSVYGTSSTFDVPGMALQHIQSVPDGELMSGFALRSWTGEIRDVVPIDHIGDFVLRFVPND